MVQIPTPLSIRHEETSAEREQYTEQKNNRAAQLRNATLQNCITAIGVVIAILSLLGLTYNLYQSRVSMEIDQRAWIGPFMVCGVIPNENGPLMPDGDCITPKKGEIRNNAAVYFKNFGKTPALNLHLFVHWASQMSDVPSSDKYVSNVGGSTSAFFPSSTENTGAPPYSETPNILYGTIWYTDIFGDDHWTRFCYEQLNDFSSFRACPKYNTTDSTQE